MTEKSTKSYGSHIDVDLSCRRLAYYERERLVRTYPVGVGKSSTPTPIGNYTVITKIMNPGGMLGSRWMGLSIRKGNYGIHGTDNPGSIGGYVSNGCIRMYNRDVEELFSIVQIRTPVCIFAADTQQESSSPREEDIPIPSDETVTHTVQAGETLWKIAARYGKTLTQITVANKISNPNRIFPGQKIIIPG